MNLFLKPIRAALRLPFFNKFWPAWLIVLLAGTGAFMAFSQSGPPNINPIALSQDPLYGDVVVDKPTLTLALSVEVPTVGALHLTTIYFPQYEYLGYWNAESCYNYNNRPIGGDDYKRFDLSGPAESRRCTDGFSGNFLNFAASSAIDMIRMALSGGDRLIDTDSGLTILQRAVLPNGLNDFQGKPMGCYFNNPYSFPAKQIPWEGGNYQGAIPLEMRKQAKYLGGGSILVNNISNQIFFGVEGRPKEVKVLTTADLEKDDDPPDQNDQCVNDKTLKYYTLKKKSYPAESDNFFYARVQVCNVDASKVLLDVRDYSFCARQPNGYYKPTGSIQKYSDQMRLAAFGYLMDRRTGTEAGSSRGPASDRYGGVLRVPMKYVGAKTFDANGLDNTPTGGNPYAEWDANTGVFKANPDGDTTQATRISGVINYLNKFGRIGGKPGLYKLADPVGELYGEALRYLQGLAPTPEAVKDLTNPLSSLYDGFPVFKTWSDPYGAPRTNDRDYSCLKAIIAVVGDVNTYDGDNSPLTQNRNSESANLPNFSAFEELITLGFEAGNTAYSYKDGKGVLRYTVNPNPANRADFSPKHETMKSILSGQAWWARSHDIRGTAWTEQPGLQRPGLRVKSFFFDVNEFGDSTKDYGGDDEAAYPTNYYRKYRNQFFRASKYGGYQADANNPTRGAYNTYGNPFKNEDGTDDNNVWQNPAEPGEASTYYLASDARATLSAFDSIFSRAITVSRNIAKSAVDKTTLNSSGSLIYQGAFDNSTWSGDVLAIPLTLAGIDPTPAWTAATQLSARSAASRNIVIGRTSTGAESAPNPVASNFTWANLDASMRAHLSKITPSSTADALGPDRVNYLRGDRSKESATFRARADVLGDIVNSGIVYSGTPTLNITPSTDVYQSFYNNNSGRTAAIFVGANDGMLHAFNASNGNELFGYIPSWMGPKLAALTHASYNANHQAYVDATPAVAEAKLGDAGTAADWKTVLVGGTGAGGPGVYALDVTNPEAFSASSVLWEFTKSDDADMGYVVGSPKIIKVRTSDSSTSEATYRWFAVVASGVNNYLPYTDARGTFYSATGNPALFFLALDKPAGTGWRKDDNYYKLTVPVDTTLNAANATGLINFQAILGPVKELAQIYMGDLHGRVWKLDFTTLGIASSSAPSFDDLSFYRYSGGGVYPYSGATKAYPMFIAKTATGAVQPITMAPLVASAAISGGLRTSYITFGTGKYLEVSDKSSTAQNSFYTLYDDGTNSANAGGASIPGRGRLIAGTATTVGQTSTVSVPSFLWGRPTTDSDTSKRSGWYFDYASVGERSLSGVSITGDQLVFGSVIPADSSNAGSCTAGGGGGNKYKVNVDTGNGSFSASAVGLFGEILTFDISGATDSSVSISNSTGRRVTKVTTTTVDIGTKGAQSSPSPTLTTFVSGRLSWRQINNYQDLKNAP